MVQGRLIVARRVVALACASGFAARADPLDVAIGEALFRPQLGRGAVIDRQRRRPGTALRCALVRRVPCRRRSRAAWPQWDAVRWCALAMPAARGDPSLWHAVSDFSALPGIAPEGERQHPLARRRWPARFAGRRDLGYGRWRRTRAWPCAARRRCAASVCSNPFPAAQIRSRADPHDRNSRRHFRPRGARALRLEAPPSRPSPRRRTWRSCATSGFRPAGTESAGANAPRPRRACRAAPHRAREPGDVEVPDTLARHDRRLCRKSFPPPAPLEHRLARLCDFHTRSVARRATPPPRGRGGDPVPAYTDLLLHDMGAGSTTASPKAMRGPANGARRHCGTWPRKWPAAGFCTTAARAM